MKKRLTNYKLRSLKCFLLYTFPAFLLLVAPLAQAQGTNVMVANPDARPVPVKIVSGGGGGGGGDASAANQTAVQANPGSDASKAVAVQGVTGGKAVPVSGTFWQATQPVSLSSLPALATGSNTIGTVNLGTLNGAATAAKQPALGTAGTASSDVITVQGIASGTAQPVSGTVTANANNVVTTAGATTYTATTTSGTALAANASRADAVIVNYGANPVCLARGATAVYGTGIWIGANGGSYSIEGTNLYRGIITAITSTGTSTLAISEGQ